MNYAQVLDFLYKQLPMYQRIGTSAFKKNLDNIILLCQHVDNPQDALKCIHIAGTNGKGSTAHILASLMQDQGYNIGLYTSPHYIDYTERIKINGALIDKDFVIQFVQKIKAIPSFGKTLLPSFFEITVALAFSYFKSKKVDYAIIETGLGGRLDSTNIIDPILCIITNISFDHQHMLGDTLAEIAAEKAGIIKPNVPLIIGERQEEINSIFTQKAAEVSAQISYTDRCQIQYNQGVFTSSKYTYQYEIFADYQIKNSKTAISAFEYLSEKEDWSIQNKSFNINTLLSKWRYMGRMQMIQNSPKILIDSAHNQAGLEEANKTLEKIKFNKLYILIGMVAEKEAKDLLSLLPQDAHFIFTQAKIPRKMPLKKLTNAGDDLGLQYDGFYNSSYAYDFVKEMATEEDLVFCCGSIFLIAEIIQHNSNFHVH